MKKFIFILITLNLISISISANASTNNSSNEQNICHRPKQLVKALEKTINKKCNDIGPEDLLTVTSLEAVEIEELKPDTFSGLNNLEILSFSPDSKINSIPTNTFLGLTNLKELHIWRHDLISIEPHAFAGLSNLRVLDLSDARELTFIATEAFAGLTNLELLNVSYNRLKKIDANLFVGLSKLKRLKWTYTNLTEITPNNFAHLTQLELLNLEESKRLTTIHAEAFEGLSSLKELTLTSADNISTFVPGTFKGLNQLETLSFQSKSFTNIELHTFAGLDNLKHLHMYYSRALRSIEPCSFEQVPNLVVLNMFGNLLDAINPNIFLGLSKLKKLDFGFNKLVTLDANTFEHLPSLEELNLIASNSLTSIAANTFARLKNLKTLQFSNENNLTTLSNEYFSGLHNLENLEWSSTTINSISSDAFAELKNLKNLKLSLNMDLISVAALREGLGSICESPNLTTIAFMNPLLSDPTSIYYCPKSPIPNAIQTWNRKEKSLLFSSFSLNNPQWINQMEQTIPEIQSSLVQFWPYNNSLLNVYFYQMPLFSGDINELQLVRQLAVDVCALEARFCDTRQRIHAYPGPTELHETRELLKLLIRENAPAKHISTTQKMEKHLSFLVEGTIDLMFWNKNLPLKFKPILDKLSVVNDDKKEQKLLIFSNLAAKTRIIMEQMDENEIKSHAHFAAIFYTQLVREVKKIIAGIYMLDSKKNVLISLTDLGRAERLLTNTQVNALKRLVLNEDYESFLNKYTTWAIERINFDLGSNAKNPESMFFDFYNSIIKTSILNEVEKVTNSL